MASASKQNFRQTRGGRSTDTTEHKEFDIPYFAHQQLDPAHFSEVLGLTIPVGKPGWAPAPQEIATASNGGWEDDVNTPFEDDFDLEDDVSLHSATATAAASTRKRGHRMKRENPYKRIRVVGGRPAVAKKVTADLDSDDELIVRMKNAKYLEKDIAQRLIDEGRTAYNPKTIGTRWARIKKALAIRNDELLDAEATDWHDGDDDVLYQAYQRADEITERAKAEAEERKWRLVADQMKSLRPVTNFSHNACRQRYEALQMGTAKPTPESIENPDAATLERIRSRQEREARIQADTAHAITSFATQENLEGNAWHSKGVRYD